MAILLKEKQASKKNDCDMIVVIGVGAIVNNNLNTCGDCMVGAVVIKDIKEPGTYIGVPVKEKNMLKNKRGEVQLNSFTFGQKRHEVAA